MATYCDNHLIDNRDGHYYVSVISGPKQALALGPFDTHLHALLRVDNVRRNIRKVFGDYDLAFAGFGTARMELHDNPPQGKANGLL